MLGQVRYDPKVSYDPRVEQRLHHRSRGHYSPVYGHYASHHYAYIASDNKNSSNQINDTVRWAFTVKPPQSCHMDIQQQDSHCGIAVICHITKVRESLYFIRSGWCLLI